jgi:hypothetical protein
MNRVTGNDQREAWIATVFRSRAEHSHPRSDCPSPERIWDAVRLQGPVEERLELIDHVSECPTCAEAWSLAAELEIAHEQLDQPNVTAPAPASVVLPVSTRSFSASYGRNALLIATAALLLALGIGFIVFRPADPPDAASIESSPKAPPTSAPPAAQQTPNSVPAPTPVPPPAPGAALADRLAILRLILEYEMALQRKGGALGSDPDVYFDSFRIDSRTATATIRRLDTVLIRGERQVQTSTHELAFEKTAAGSWVVVSARPNQPPSSPVVESQLANALERLTDETAIRRVIDTFNTAIETNDLRLLVSIRPGGARGEEEAARLLQSLRQNDRQMTVTIDDIRVDGNDAIVRVSRPSVIAESGGRRTLWMSSRQTLHLEKSPSGWIITAIEPLLYK